MLTLAVWGIEWEWIFFESWLVILTHEFWNLRCVEREIRGKRWNFLFLINLKLNVSHGFLCWISVLMSSCSWFCAIFGSSAFHFRVNNAWFQFIGLSSSTKFVGMYPSFVGRKIVIVMYFFWITLPLLFFLISWWKKKMHV